MMSGTAVAMLMKCKPKDKAEALRMAEQDNRVSLVLAGDTEPLNQPWDSLPPNFLVCGIIKP